MLLTKKGDDFAREAYAYYRQHIVKKSVHQWVSSELNKRTVSCFPFFLIMNKHFWVGEHFGLNTSGLATILSIPVLFKDTANTLSLPDGFSSLPCALWVMPPFPAWVFSQIWPSPVSCLLSQFVWVYPWLLTLSVNAPLSACLLLPLSANQITWTVFWILPLGLPLGLLSPILWITVYELCYFVNFHSVDYCVLNSATLLPPVRWITVSKLCYSVPPVRWISVLPCTPLLLCTCGLKDCCTASAQACPFILLCPKSHLQTRVVFSRAKPSSLPLYWPYDCAIDLLMGTIPPMGCLSRPERDLLITCWDRILLCREAAQVLKAMYWLLGTKWLMT